MTTGMQLFSIFAFGLVVAGVTFLGVVRAREYEKKAAKQRKSNERREKH